MRRRRLAGPLLLALLPLPAAAPGWAQETGVPPPRVGDQLDGTRWRAESVNGAPLADPGAATLEFVRGEHVRGQAACNRFVGPYATRDDRIVLGPLRLSRLDCGPDGNRLAETLLVELRRANKVLLTPDRLELLPTRGPATVFVRQP